MSRKDTLAEKLSLRWARTTKANESRLKARKEQTHESDCLHKMWLTGCASIQRGGETHSQSGSNPGQDLCGVSESPGLASHESLTLHSSLSGRTGQAERPATRR